MKSTKLFHKIAVLSFTLVSTQLVSKSCDEVYDFIIVGAGNTGCVLANRLSEDGKFTVCVLEAGRDDARLPELLPNPSPANVPQPQEFQWGDYERGGGVPPYVFDGALVNRGFGAFRFYAEQDETGPAPNRRLAYPRHSAWGGCTQHNAGITIRNPPQNWNKWAALGLNEWSFDQIKNFYFLTENRSQISGAFSSPFYNPALPLGSQGSFDPTFYGYNGMVPILWLDFVLQVPPLLSFVNTIQGVVNTTLAAFSYPITLIDADWPNDAAQKKGGLTLNNFTLTDQNPTSTIVPPGQSSLVSVNTGYNPYGDGGFVFPPEYARLGLTGLAPSQRVSAANTYLYAAEGRRNLTIKSEVLVTKLIIPDDTKRVMGVEYLNGWNIYQTGRNTDVGNGGYGGTAGDAEYNASLAKEEGTKKVYARKEVILCAGVFNSPHILMLSGIGDKSELKQLGIKVKKHLPGVGKHLIENHALFAFWELDPNLVSNPVILLAMQAKSTTGQQYPNFTLAFGGINNVSLESGDPFVQKNWVGLKNPALWSPFYRNDFDHILLDPTQPNANPVVPPSPPYFEPIIVNPSNILGMFVEQEEDSRTEGYVRLVSKDPTVPPRIVYNHLKDPRDLQDWLDIMNTHVLPIILALQPSGYFTNLLFPAPADILNPGVINFTDMSQVNQARLANFLVNNVEGHHAAGTCKMGVESDPLAVVDQKGRVHGVKGLRVCDYSIVPISIFWPNGTLYVIGEKFSKDILDTYR